MFVLTDKRTVAWPVKVRTAKDGKTVEQTFEATWDIPTVDQIEEAVGAAADPARLRPFLAERLVGWSDIEDAQGNAVPYGEEAKAALLRWTDALDALAVSFTEALHGGRSK